MIKLFQVSELASSLSCLTIQHRFTASSDSAWVVQGNHLSSEASCFHWWVICTIISHIATMDIFDRHILTLKPTFIPQESFTQNYMLHFNWLDLTLMLTEAKMTTMPGLRTPVPTRPTGTVPIPLISETSGRTNPRAGQLGELVSGCNPELQAEWLSGIATFTGGLPSLEPRHTCTWLQHIVTIPTRNWHKCDCIWVVAHFLNVVLTSLTISSLSLQLRGDSVESILLT